MEWGLAALVVAAILILSAIFVFQNAGGPLLPQQYELTCHEKNGPGLVKANISCAFSADCEKWASQNCGPENSCNNKRVVCSNSRCMTETYFRLDRTCV